MNLLVLLLAYLRVTRAVDYDEDDYDEDEVGVRSGLDMLQSRFPGSLLLATSGNNTGTTLGTWSSNAIASTVFEFYQGESVIVNGHDFGGWKMGSQGHLLRVQQKLSAQQGEKQGRPNMKGGRLETSKERLDVNLLMTKLWTSAIVRDNIVTTFGFILNRPKNPLPADLYASLLILYNVIRLRRIHTLDVLPVLKKMSYSTPQEQFVELFEELHRHVPAYLKSSVSVWVETLTDKRLDLNAIIRPGGGPCEVDFLASVEPSVLELLDQPLNFDAETVERASTTIKVLMGPTFSCVFAGLYDKSIKLTQPLFALILLHLPLDQIVPQKDETERYIVDALRLNAIKHWDEVVDGLSQADVIDPFRLVRAVLQGIANCQKIDWQIRRDALYALPYIKVTTSTYASEHYAVMSEVVGSPSIKFKQLLDHVTRLTCSTDVLALKERLMFYTLNGYIEVESAVAGFIRYDYTSPCDLLIAILSRIQRRLPNLSDEILGTVKALQAHLVFHKLLSQTPSHFPTDLIYIPSLLDAFCDPSLPANVPQISKTLSGFLDEEKVDWKTLMGEMLIKNCTAPRQCFLTVMRKAIDEHLLTNSRIVRLFKKLSNILDENEFVKGVSEQDMLKLAESSNMTVIKPQQQESQKLRGIVHIYPTPTLPPSKPVETIKPHPSHYSVEFAAYNYTIRFNASLLDIIPLVPEMEPIISIIESNTIPELHQLSKHFYNKTRAEALLLILETLLHCSPVQSSSSLVSTINDYIHHLITIYGLSRPTVLPKLYKIPPPGTDFPALTPNNYYLPAVFEQREFLLPYTVPFSPKDVLLKPIRDYITRADLLKILGPEFKPSEYPTKFLLLRAILERAVSTQIVQEDFYLHNLVKRYLVFLTHQAEMSRPTVNWITILDALPHAKDEQEYMSFSVLREFITSAELKAYMKEFDVRRYPTRGMLLKNFLRHLLTIKQLKERPELLKSIKYFVDKVYMHGFGAKAVEYIVIKQHVIRRTIDLQKAFQAIDLKELNIKAKRALKAVYKFFEKEFQPPIHLANFDFLKYQTKGEWLKAYFTYLANHSAVSMKARKSLSIIIPYILSTGPGAESVD